MKNSLSCREFTKANCFKVTAPAPAAAQELCESADKDSAGLFSYSQPELMT